MAGEEDALRASDRDREIVAGQLREALEAGRLTVAEFDDRVSHVYASKTYGDLKVPLADLPVAPPNPFKELTAVEPVSRDLEVRCVAVSTAFFLLIITVAVIALVARLGTAF